MWTCRVHFKREFSVRVCWKFYFVKSKKKKSHSLYTIRFRSILDYSRVIFTPLRRYENLNHRPTASSTYRRRRRRRALAFRSTRHHRGTSQRCCTIVVCYFKFESDERRRTVEFYFPTTILCAAVFIVIRQRKCLKNHKELTFHCFSDFSRVCTKIAVHFPMLTYLWYNQRAIFDSLTMFGERLY